MDTSIYICSLSRLEETVAQKNARYVVTAINPWSIPETPASVSNANHLRIAINDIDAPHSNLVHPEAHHINQLIEFAQRWNRDGPLVAHCLAGISRSSASAYIMACALNPATPERDIARTLRKASLTASPNLLMVRHADELLNRRGRMIAAIKALSPGSATMEADTFSIPSYY
jgi:predicted protein tyrosine phosphatase